MRKERKRLVSYRGQLFVPLSFHPCSVCIIVGSEQVHLFRFKMDEQSKGGVEDVMRGVRWLWRDGLL